MDWSLVDEQFIAQKYRITERLGAYRVEKKHESWFFGWKIRWEPITNHLGVWFSQNSYEEAKSIMQGLIQRELMESTPWTVPERFKGK